VKINRTFQFRRDRDQEMREHAQLIGSPEYAQLLASLGTGDHTSFRSSLGALFERFGSHVRSPLLAIARESEQAITWLIDIFCKQDEDPELNGLAFFVVGLVGTKAMPALRTAWDREQTLNARGRVHMCMMDTIGRAGNDAEQKRAMLSIAEQEIPKWIETLRTEKPSGRTSAIMMLLYLLPYAPANLDQVRSLISDSLALDFPPDDDPKGLEVFRTYAARMLETLSKSRPYWER
jgi:hypothetical protein